MEGFYRLPFAVMKLSGSVEKFAQGMATNTLGAARNAFVDVYGRIVVVFYQRLVGGELYIAFNEKYAPELHAHLLPYLRLGKVTLEPTALKPFFVFGEEDNGMEGVKIPEKNSFVLLSESPPKGIMEMDEDKFLRFRLENGISMQGSEFEGDMIMNTDWKDAVSFSKGCFLGQEIVVKVTQRGRPPKRLVRVAFQNEPVKVTRDGKDAGEVRSKRFSRKLGKWIAYCSLPNDGLGVDAGEILQ